ncbi:MAG: hypothetical protein O3A65_07245 [Proteobacteria bacterium]|nr:hypothetical protein [Pseudomonadota bacterium]
MITPLVNMSVVSVSGGDATAFLDSQLTSDIKNLTDKKLLRSGYCNPKGRLIATPYVFRNTDSFNLLLPDNLVDEFVSRLSRFILRAKVKITLNEGDAAIGLIAKSRLLPITEIDTIVGVQIMSLNATQAILVCPFDSLGLLWGHLTATHLICREDLWRLEAIRNGIVNVNNDTKEHFLPQMINLDKGDGVSFTKGCYPGQEIVARTKYLGSVKRKLYQFKSDTPLHAGMTLLNASGATSGLVCDTAPVGFDNHGYEGLAVIQSEYVNEQHLTSSNLCQIEVLKAF